MLLRIPVFILCLSLICSSVRGCKALAEVTASLTTLEAMSEVTVTDDITGFRFHFPEQKPCDLLRGRFSKTVTVSRFEPVFILARSAQKEISFED